MCSFVHLASFRAGRKFTMMDSVNPSSSPAAAVAAAAVDDLNLQQKQMSSSLNPQSRVDRQTISRIISTITVVVVVVVFHRFPTWENTSSRRHRTCDTTTHERGACTLSLNRMDVWTDECGAALEPPRDDEIYSRVQPEAENLQIKCNVKTP